MSVPGAVVSAEVINAIREGLRPFTLAAQLKRIAAFEERVKSGETTRDEAPPVVLNAVRDVEEGGRLSLTHLTVTDHYGHEYQWQNDENAPLDSIDGSLSARVTFENAKANLSVVVESAPHQARLHVSTDFGLRPGRELRRIEPRGYEAATIAEAMREILKQHVVQAGTARVPGVPFRVFIGHGGDTKWQVVRDFIEAAGYELDYFEVGDRFGQATFEVVERMIAEASVAVIVMTGVDRLADGRILARQNVVHELGFAHGKLGARHTLILLEDGTDEPSNIAGVTQIRFPLGDINQAKPDLLAALANRKRDRDDGSSAR